MPQVDLARLDLPPRVLACLQDLLKAHVPDAEVWAYGSRVSGGAHEGSDLDIVLRPSALGEQPAGWLDLKDALQQSAIPIIVDTHLWQHLPASFQDEIEQAYVVLQRGRV
ncbi:nucleotidyltransferase family protein [Novosphingobium capsulatum]|uniref:nucleotidyltransferase family protein n=1 Tax=Novosphingobium capsulatum TaxID=13688 RepID=UPI0007886992|nr:nucleotidyltransferase domain-containing protein [Novosphingobium capsulatum]WQD92421.1 nucleotidyltransferase domain-containing protein [Novosphingobium capsulatum]